MAMKYFHFISFGYLSSFGNFNIDEIMPLLEIKCLNCENIFIFKENPEVIFFIFFIFLDYFFS